MNHFTEKEVELMRMLLRRLEPGTLESLQFFTKQNEFRTGCTMCICNKWGKEIYVLQNYRNLSPYRKKLILRLSTQLPYKIHITQPQEDITRIGWKWEK